MTSLLISLAAGLMIVFHAASWGQIDPTSVVFFLIFVSPWLFPFVTKISLPGGGGLEIREEVEALEKQTERIVTSRPFAPILPNQVALAYRVIDEDPNLALASIRMGLEQVLRQLSGPDEPVKYPLGEIVKILASREILSDTLVEPIVSITRICNRALHQADVDRPTAQRIIAASIPVFEALNDALNRSGNSVA